MNLRFVDGGMLRRLVDGVKELVPEVLMTVSAEEGIKWQEMDSSHVSLVAAHLKPNSFSTLQMIPPAPNRTVPLGVNMVALSKILRCVNKTDDVSWKINEKTTDILEISTDKPSSATKKKADSDEKVKLSGGRSGKFALKLMEIDREALAVPDTDYAAHIFLRSTTFQRTIKDLMPFATDVTITVKPDEVIFAFDGDHGKGELTLPNIRHPKVTVASFDCFQQSKLSAFIDNDDDSESAYIFLKDPNPSANPVQLKFAMRFLASFAQCTSLSPHLQISIEKDTPIRLLYPLYSPNLTPPPPPPSEEASKTELKENKESKEDAKKSGVKRKKKDENEVVVPRNTKGNEPGSQDIVGMVSFYLAPKIEETESKSNNDAKSNNDDNDKPEAENDET